MLVDVDSKPQDTIFYIAMQIHQKIMKLESIKISHLENIFNDINSNQPSFKYYLGLNFLYMVNRIEIVDDEVRYVSN